MLNATMAKPHLDNSKFLHHPATPGLASSIVRVATRIDELGAWPSHEFAPYELKLTVGNAINTFWGASPSNRAGRTMEINARDPLRIEIGIDLFTNGLGHSLALASNLDRDVVLFHLLAHEIFHLTELDRMSQCCVPYGQHRNGFATALWADFNSHWLEAGLKLSENFHHARVKPTAAQMPPQKLYSLDSWRAADIATEACADMLALNLMVRAGGSFAKGKPTYAQVLLLKRQADQAAAPASPPDNPDYQIGTALAALLNLEPLTDTQIVSHTWELAFNAALVAEDLWPDVCNVIKPMPQLTRVVPKSPSPR